MPAYQSGKIGPKIVSPQIFFPKQHLGIHDNSNIHERIK